MRLFQATVKLSAALWLSTFFFLGHPALAKTKGDTGHSTSPQDLNALVFTGQIDRALAQLKNQNLKKLKGDYQNRLRFIQGYLYYQTGEVEKAADIFKELKDEYAALKDYSRYFLALSLRDGKDAKEAIEILNQLKGENISRYLKQKIDRELALAYCKAKDRGKAVTLFNELIQTEPSEIRSYHLKYDRSLCLIELGYGDEAVPTLKALYLNYPEGDLSQKILGTLNQLNRSSALSVSDHLTRGERLMAKDRPQLAAQDFQWVVDSYSGQAPGTLLKQLAEAYFKSRQYPQAADIYEKIRNRHPELFDAETKLRLAQSYSRSDQFDAAIKAYEYLAATEPSQNAKELEYKIAYVYMDKGDLKEADKRFTELIDTYPAMRPQMLWFLAWNHYRLKDYTQAQNYLEQLQSAYPRHYLADRVPYWQARILEKNGNQAAARQQYQAIVERDPFSYYGFISLKRLENNLDPTQAPKGAWVKDIPTRSVPAPFSWQRVRPGGKKRLDQAQELLLVGLWEDFLGELGELTYGEGITGEVAKLKQAVDGNGSGVVGGSERWSASYPDAYPTLVGLFSKIRGFPMPAAWAIMREESRFRADALSPAQAIGLMQIIPPTGAEIAADLGRRGYVPEWLYQPVTNIEFGVHYLHKNMQKFNGHLPETFASYNAGPDAVLRWLKARPNREWDEFIEEIPYKETNNYVKKVLKSYYIYKIMYPDASR